MSSSANIGLTNKQDDPWEQSADVSVQAHTTRRFATKASTIPDDWDDDADEEAEEVDGEAVWREANAKLPMPEVVRASASTSSTSGAIVPPLEALQAPMRILKRPSPASGGTQANAGNASAEALQRSLKAREAAYQAARERIFGSPNAEPTSAFGSAPAAEGVSAIDDGKPELAAMQTRAKQPKQQQQQQGEGSVSVLRNPRGPTSGTSTGSSKGFGGKRGGKRGVSSKGSTPPA